MENIFGDDRSEIIISPSFNHRLTVCVVTPSSRAIFVVVSSIITIYVINNILSSEMLCLLLNYKSGETGFVEKNPVSVSVHLPASVPEESP